MLTKEQILKAKDYDLKEVEMPEWGGSVFMRSFSGKERSELEVEVTENGGNILIDSTLRARFIRKCLCDGEGNLLFAEEDIDVLNQKSAAALEKLFNLTLEVSGFSDKDVEDMEGKSEGSTD